jgi:hypothetical protein
MKKSLLLLFIFFIAAGSFGQKLEVVDGRYYKRGMLYSGTHIEHYSNGKDSMLMNILNGCENGPMELYFPSGARMEHREYNNGKKTGIWLTWDEKGTKIGEASYLDGIKNGTWYIWNSQGILLYEMHYLDGTKTGIWKQWDDKGKLLMERAYE